MTAPVTPPTQPSPQPTIYIGSTIFGAVVATAGIAFLFLDRAPSTWDHVIAGVLILLGGWCINRDPLISFAQAIGGWISAWRGHGDHDQ